LKKVITIFDLIHEQFYERGKIDKFKDNKKDAIKNADFFICISKNTQKDLINIYNVKEEKTKVIYLSSSNLPKKHIFKKKPNLIFRMSEIDLDTKILILF